MHPCSFPGRICFSSDLVSLQKLVDVPGAFALNLCAWNSFPEAQLNAILIQLRRRKALETGFLEPSGAENWMLVSGRCRVSHLPLGEFLKQKSRVVWNSSLGIPSPSCVLLLSSL